VNRRPNACIVCGDPILRELWLAARHRIPDYFCPACFDRHGRDASGEVLPTSLFPEWLRYLNRQEVAKRVRQHRARKAGRAYEAIPFSALALNHPYLDYDQHTDRSLDEIFEDLGEIVI
jgi:hypothetical protein